MRFPVLLLTAAFLATGCSEPAQPLYPGTERLLEQGMPLGGDGLPPGSPAVVPEEPSHSEAPEVPEMMQKFLIGR